MTKYREREKWGGGWVERKVDGNGGKEKEIGWSESWDEGKILKWVTRVGARDSRIKKTS